MLVDVAPSTPTHAKDGVPTYAKVIVDVPTRAITEPFDYLIPDDLVEQALPGCTVVVPLGSRHVAGYVVDVSQSTNVTAKIRPIAEVLTPPLFNPCAPELAVWIASEYSAPISEAMRLFLPPGGLPRVESDAHGGWRLSATSLGPATERVATLVPDHAHKPRRNAAAQIAVLDALSDGPVPIPLLNATLGDISGALRRLEELGAISIVDVPRRRRPGSLERQDSQVSLTQEQAHAVQALIPSGETKLPVLIDGVTGSGKTEVYMRAIEAHLAEDRGAIVLVPEIALTPQTVGRFRARFGEQIAVLHSRLSAGERYDEWWRLKNRDASVAIGPRSALFAPVHDLGVIILDESHDGSYKQGSSPRYHARDVARKLAQLTGATLAFGSATPSLELLNDARSETVTVAPLTSRVGGGTLPTTTVVDMAEEFRTGHRSMFSTPLQNALERTIGQGQKAVLLLNRRGFASFLLCRECGYVPECDSCAVSLTAHKNGTILECHHCGRRSKPPVECPECGSVYLRQFGAGTERVQQVLTELMPDVPSVRMDADTTRRKGGHEHRLAEFEGLESGVLIGTQMVAKGLDYPDVTLVGVLDADSGLHLPEFRASERTYQLLSQVSGRAGRGHSPGHVIIQTYWPDHPAIRAAAAHDRKTFVDHEIAARRELGYPPFSRLTRLLVTGEQLSAVREHAINLKNALDADASPEWSVLGPSEAVIARIKGVHRMHILVMTPPAESLGPKISSLLARLPSPEGVTVAPDVDAYDLM